MLSLVEQKSALIGQSSYGIVMLGNITIVMVESM
jgi:hypothetical protein